MFDENRRLAQQLTELQNANHALEATHTKHVKDIKIMLNRIYNRLKFKTFTVADLKELYDIMNENIHYGVERRRYC